MMADWVLVWKSTMESQEMRGSGISGKSLEPSPKQANPQAFIKRLPFARAYASQ
jgi:hypothetical protein